MLKSIKAIFNSIRLHGNQRALASALKKDADMNRMYKETLGIMVIAGQFKALAKPKAVLFPYGLVGQDDALNRTVLSTQIVSMRMHVMPDATFSEILQKAQKGYEAQRDEYQKLANVPA